MKPEPEQPGIKPEYKWLDRDIPETRADVCQVISSREETMLLFGTRERPTTGDGQHATLDRRIILSPGLAKELVADLRAFLREFEAARGGGNATPAGYIRSTPGDDDAPEAARPLLHMVRNLDVGFGFEKSFKLSAGSVLADRIILGVRSKLAEVGALLAHLRPDRHATCTPRPFREVVAGSEYRRLRL